MDTTFNETAQSAELSPLARESVPPMQKRVSCNRILLAEDEEMVRDVLQMVLESRGWTVVTASDGREAVERWDDGPYDLVLMDIQMPRLDGLGATRAIRSTEGDASRVPIIALTARATYDDQQQCLQAGMDDYLAKPLRLENLFALMDFHLNGSAAH